MAINAWSSSPFWVHKGYQRLEFESILGAQGLSTPGVRVHFGCTRVINAWSSSPFWVHKVINAWSLRGRHNKKTGPFRNHPSTSRKTRTRDLLVNRQGTTQPHRAVT